MIVTAVGALGEAGRVPTLAGTVTPGAEWRRLVSATKATDNCVTMATIAIGRRAAAVR